MYSKKLLCILTIILSLMFVFGCSSKPTNSGDQQGQEVPAVSTDPTKDTTVYIPADSSLGDSVFEDESRAPTKAENNTATDPVEDSTDKPSDNTDPTSEATAPNTPPEEMTYEAFIALTPEEQRLYQESFNDLDAFFEWYTAAKEKYEKENPPIDIDGPIDLGKY